MFGVMVFDRDPLQLGDLPALFESWVQDAGGFATLGAVLWLLLGATRVSAADRARVPVWRIAVFLGCVVGSLLCYGLYLSLRLPEPKPAPPNSPALRNPVPQVRQRAQLFLTGAGALGIIAVGLPFFIGLARLRFRRILAIAQLSFKEAVRRRVLYVFAILLLVFLFGSWFIPAKPEDQVRTYVQVAYMSLTPLLLLAGLLIAAFSIPADVRTQTIHTILTKPVERFEIILGRFLGFTALMTLVLVVISGVSLLYVVRGVTPEAAEESLKAREPLNGELSFLNTASEKRGDSVGREWDYRSYITSGPPGREQTAVWKFDAPPKSVADRDTVRCEFGFDIYRTTKGKEGKGVLCSFRFITASHDPAAYQLYVDELSKQGKNPDPATTAEKYGYFEVAGKDVTDFHTQYIDVPGGLFRNALESKGTGPAFRVEVRCADQSQPQYVGMAKYDLYLRLDDPEGGSERLAFAWNFLKGATGIWFRLCLAVGLGVAFSTQVSGVISMLLTVLLYMGGLCRDFIQEVGTGGMGPSESLYRLANRQNMNAPLDKTGTVKVAETTDYASRWVTRRIHDLVPDVDRFDLTSYVADGFNVPFDQLLLSLLLLAGYLLPFAVLAYYLLEWREVASST